MNVALGLLNRLLRWALWLVAGLLIFAALYVSLGRQFIPLLAEYRAEIEQQLQQHLQQDIQIEQLAGSWRGFSPVLAARYVTLGRGPNALQVETLRVQPDVIGSLLARELRLTAISLDGLQVHLQENQAGQWSLQGLQLDTFENTAFQLNDWLAKMQQVTQLSVLNSRVIVQPHEQEALALTYAGFTLSRSGPQQRLDFRAILPDGEKLELSAQGQLVDKDWQRSSLAVYLNLPSSNLAQWLPNLPWPGWMLDNLQLNGELWLQAEHGQLQQAVLQLAELELQGQAAHTAPLHIQGHDLKGFYQHTEGMHSAWFTQLPLHIDQRAVHDWRFTLTYAKQLAPVWDMAIAQLKIADVDYLAGRLLELPELASEVLASMQPSGQLNNLQVQWRPEATWSERLSFISSVQDVGFSAWRDVPAAGGISGQISGDLTQGELRLASTDGFSLHLAKLFAKPWRYERANAQLLWQFDEQGFTLESPYLQVQGEEGEIAGDFLIRLLREPDAEDYMDLRVGLRNGDARFTEKYLPSRVAGFSADLAHWLSTAIQGGDIEQGYFQYQGSLNAGTPPESRSMSLYFDVTDAQLEYQPGWPKLTEAAAQVFIEDSGVRINLEHGKVLNTPLSSAYAEVALARQGQTPTLQLQADLLSNVADGLYFLQKTPLADAAVQFSKWQGQGDLPATLELSVPLVANPSVQIKLALNALNAELQMPEINVHLHALNGQLVFDSQRGLSAKKMTGQFLGQAFSGHIDAQGQAGHLVSHIDVQGLMPIEQLSQWAGITQPIPVSGVLPYRLRVLLEGDDSQLRVDSNLQGVKVDLPAPFAKTAGEQRYADWRMTLSGAERRYWFEYGEQLSLNLAAPPGNILGGRGQVRVGGGLASLPTQQGMQLRGSLPVLDVADWQQLLARYRLSEQGSGQLLTSAQLTIQRLSGYGLSADNLDITFQPQTSGWQLSVRSELLQGKITERGTNKPLQVQFARLHLPKSLVQGVAAQGDAFADFEINTIPALDIHIDALYHNAENLGPWSFSTRPQGQGVLFENLELSLKGLQVSGQLGWQRDNNGAMHSWYKGRLAGDNLKDVLLAWGFAPTITSDSFRVDSDVHWAGSPAVLGLSKLSGDLDVSFRKGQLVSVDGSSQALRVFGLLNFDSIGRRLRLDFSDLLDKGLAYDRVKGKVRVVEGVYRTQTPLLVEGPSSNLDLQGQFNAVTEQVNATLVVTLPLTNNLPLAAVAVGAPVVGGALFLVDRLLGDRISRFASVTYHINGDWQHPNISLFKKDSKQQ